MCLVCLGVRIAPQGKRERRSRVAGRKRLLRPRRGAFDLLCLLLSLLPLVVPFFGARPCVVVRARRRGAESTLPTGRHSCAGRWIARRVDCRRGVFGRRRGIGACFNCFSFLLCMTERESDQLHFFVVSCLALRLFSSMTQIFARVNVRVYSRWTSL